MKAIANSPLNVAQQPSTDLDEHPEHPKSKLKILSLLPLSYSNLKFKIFIHSLKYANKTF